MPVRELATMIPFIKFSVIMSQAMLLVVFSCRVFYGFFLSLFLFLFLFQCETRRTTRDVYKPKGKKRYQYVINSIRILISKISQQNTYVVFNA